MVTQSRCSHRLKVNCRDVAFTLQRSPPAVHAFLNSTGQKTSKAQLFFFCFFFFWRVTWFNFFCYWFKPVTSFARCVYSNCTSCQCERDPTSQTVGVCPVLQVLCIHVSANGESEIKDGCDEGSTHECRCGCGCMSVDFYMREPCPSFLAHFSCAQRQHAALRMCSLCVSTVCCPLWVSLWCFHLLLCVLVQGLVFLLLFKIHYKTCIHWARRMKSVKSHLCICFICSAVGFKDDLTQRHCSGNPTPRSYW